MKNIKGFPAISNSHSKILILGSMPSEGSLLKQQYYGHQRNAFWPIILSLFGKEDKKTNLNSGIIKPSFLNAKEMSYNEHKLLLLENHIAVWDVLQSCYREGSLDTAIKMDSIKVNNFSDFFATHTKIKTICFNGSKAEAIYNKYVLPIIKNEFKGFQYIKLPSTSPAYAAMNLQEKAIIWANSVKYNTGERA